MNVLILDSSVAFTGAFKCALNEAELLGGEHKFFFVLPKQTNLLPLLNNKGITTYVLPMRELSRKPSSLFVYPFFLLKNTIALKKILRKENIDVVQVNDFYNLLGAAVKLFGFKGKLITYVRFLPAVIPSPLRKLWTGIGQKYSNRMIAVSDAVLHQLPPHSNTIRIYDPVFLSETMKEENKMNNEVKFLYMSNFTRGKGQEYAINAFIQAYKINKNIRLKFIGGDMGLQKNIDFKNELIKTIIDLQFNDVVSFHSFTTDIECEIKEADVVLNFSEGESFSMTCLEGAYYSRPVIATRCGGPEEIIQDKVTGILVNKADVLAMANAMLQLANNPQQRIEFGKKGKEYVSNKFSVDNFKTQFKTIFHNA